MIGGVCFEIVPKQEARRHEIDRLYIQKMKIELVEKANALGVLRNSDDFQGYSRLLQLIPNQFNESDRNKIRDAIHSVIERKCNNEFKPELWIKGIIKEISEESLTNFFHDSGTSTENRILILSKLKVNKQFELFTKYIEYHSVDEGISLLEQLIRKENRLDYYFKLIPVLFNEEFWKDKKGNELSVLCTNYIYNQSNDEQKYKYFIKGYIKNAPKEILLSSVSEIGEEDCRRIFKNIAEDKPFQST